jgi:Tol biopolymer transport system component
MLRPRLDGVARLLTGLLLGAGLAASATGAIGARASSGPPQLSGPPTPAAATRAFGRWLHVRYGDIQGAWTCPVSQLYGDGIECLSEFRAGGKWHRAGATATISHHGIVFSKPSQSSWVRRWSTFSGEPLRRGGITVGAGLASVNSPAFDWGWLAEGVQASWKRHRTFRFYDLDGPGGWPARFFEFSCVVRKTLVTCTNSFGDSMRYLPEGRPAAIVFARNYAGIIEMSADGTNPRRLTRGLDSSPRWSPDHRWVAFARGDDTRPKASQEIWLIRPDGSKAHRLTDMYPGQAWGPTWSPDGRRIAFVGQRHGAAGTGIWVVNVDGSGTTTITNNTNDNDPAWSPDGRRIAFVRGDSERLYVMDSDGRNAHPVLEKLPAAFGGCQQASPSWSPDSKSIVFGCTDRGAIWIVHADGTQPERLISGGNPDWEANGSWIAFVAGSQSIYKIRSDRTKLVRLTRNPAGDDSPDW